MPSPHRWLAFVTGVAALGGFLFGYDTAVISGAIGALRQHFALDEVAEGWAGASAIWGCLPGALAAGFLADRFGRRRLLLLCAALYAGSGLWSAFAADFANFLASRFAGGLAIGISSMVCPTYIAEIAPERRRGVLGTLFQLGIVVGIFLVFFVNERIQAQGDAAWNATHGWRWMLGSEALPAAVFLLLLCWVPESPRWLLLRGRRDEARAVLARAAGAEAAERELAAILAASSEGQAPLRALFAPEQRRPLLIAAGLAVLSQASGINAIMYYAPRVFEAAGASTDAAFARAVWVGAINLAFTIVAIALIDRLGRRPLLLAGAAVQTLALAGVGLSFGGASAGQAGAGITTLAAVLVYVAAFAVAMGPVPWVLISEIFPGPIRGRAVAVGVGTIWAACLLVAQTFPVLKDRLGPGVTFGLYAGCSALSLVFVWALVPETKGRRLEEIAASWRRP
ncbi:MAG: sugar porter family MFS transporter [Planctomycetes bacterium]|nr:sugar porter family MFS transporter [Planctomycetota bacterium]